MSEAVESNNSLSPSLSSAESKIQTSLTREQKEAVGLLSIGTFLEYFDLMLYVHMAVLLNELFFPKTDPFTASLLSAFAFCSTYLLRPFGALIFGYIGDHIGRKHTVIITTFMMAISCTVMANLPTYAQIGITATWIITICRIIQGMSAMGEVIGAELYLTELVRPPIQYVAVGIVTVFASVGGMIALAVATYSMKYNMNWRVAFWIGAVIALVGMRARLLLRETPEFINAKKRLKAGAVKLISKQKTNTKSLLSIFFFQCSYPACFYFLYIHCANILKSEYGLSAESVIAHNFFLSMIQVFSFLFFTLLSYKFNPLKLLYFKLAGFSFSLIIFSICLFKCDYYHFSIIQGFLVFFILSFSSAMPICYKSIPVFKRFTYGAFLYALSRALIYLLTSFGLIILSHYMGVFGILMVIVPILFLFFYAITHFLSVADQVN